MSTGHEPALGATWDDVVRLLQSILEQVWGDERQGCDYGQYLGRVFDQWLQSDAQKSRLGLLPVLTCQACGGNPGPGLVVAASWQSVRIAAKVFDDVEDGETGCAPGLLNAATGFLVVAPLALAELLAHGIPAPLLQDIATHLSMTILRCSAGQHADLTTSVAETGEWTPDSWLKIALTKSGELLAWAAWAGAAAAGANRHTCQCYREYGRRLGVLLQIADDYNDVWGAAETGDLATGKMNLAVCYALSVLAGDERQHLEALLAKAQKRERGAEAEARAMLANVGAQHYMLCAAALQRGLAETALSKVAPTTRDGLHAQEQLEAFLDAVIPPMTSIRAKETAAGSP